MDILVEIKDKVGNLPDEIEITGLNSIITHIERAEYYLSHGKTNSDTNYFTDVIYRSNQAFEGILKEAYKYIALKEIGKKKIYQIENYFLRNRILNYRVLDLFKNYRQNWRNPSTHDYNLFFSSHEAFLAIVSVSSFIYVLLDQIIEVTAYSKEKSEIEKQTNRIDLTSNAYIKGNLAEEVISLLNKFNKIGYNMDVLTTESEIIGVLTALFEAFTDDITLVREPLLSKTNKKLRADFLIQRGNERVILEIKRRYDLKSADSARHQMSEYLNAIDIASGIIFFPGSNKRQYGRKEMKYEYMNKERTIFIIHEK